MYKKSLKASKLLSLALVCCVQLAQSSVYQWRDQKGQLHFSDTPPNKGDYQVIKVSAQVITQWVPVQTIKTVSKQPRKQQRLSNRAVTLKGNCQQAKKKVQKLSQQLRKGKHGSQQFDELKERLRHWRWLQRKRCG